MTNLLIYPSINVSSPPAEREASDSPPEGALTLGRPRWGHLIQNRYKSIVCDEDAYFRELVHYIHLNPLRAKLVKSLAALDRYRWCGHSVLMGRVKEVSAIRGCIVPPRRE